MYTWQHERKQPRDQRSAQLSDHQGEVRLRNLSSEKHRDDHLRPDAQAADDLPAEDK